MSMKISISAVSRATLRFHAPIPSRMPNSAMLRYSEPPRIRWSCSGIPTIRPASASCRVISSSSLLGSAPEHQRDQLRAGKLRGAEPENLLARPVVRREIRDPAPRDALRASLSLAADSTVGWPLRPARVERDQGARCGSRRSRRISESTARSSPSPR